MSSQNDDSKGMIMVFAFVGAVFYMMAIFAMILFTFISLVLTVICFSAWNRPRRLGNHVLMPEEARNFVWRGINGAFLAPLFCIFLELFANIIINADYLPHIIVGGYALGSLGCAIVWAEEQSAIEPTQTIIPPSQQIAPLRSEEPPRPPFRFASWDDEDGR